MNAEQLRKWSAEAKASRLYAEAKASRSYQPLDVIAEMAVEIAAQLAEANELARLRLRWDTALSDTVRSEIREEVEGTK